MSEQRTKRKELVGTVIKLSGEKTRAILIETAEQHPVYKKTVKRTKKMLVHDEANQSAVGDDVLLNECRPISKRKSWRVVNVIKKA